MAARGFVAGSRIVLATIMTFVLLTLSGSLAYATEASGGTVTDGDTFTAALGNQAECTTEGDVCIITLNGDVELNGSITLNTGSYILQGQKTITRATDFTEPLIKVSSGVSLEITDHVIIDGGARWTKDDVTTGSAIGAKDSANASTKWAIIDNLGGTFKLSGDAQVCNNNGRCGIWGNNGAQINIAGGEVHGIRSDDGGGAVACQDTVVTITGGELWGNEIISGFRPPRGSAVYAFEANHAQVSSIAISGGTIRDSSGPAAVLGTNVTVTGGTFSNNAGTALGSDASSNTVSVSGGIFTNNAGGLYAPIGESTKPLHLSGNPSFGSTADETVHATVNLDDALDNSVEIQIQLASYKLGNRVVIGEPDLLAAHHEQFKLVGSDAGYIVNQYGRIDTEASSIATPGDAIAATLGGTCAYDEDSGVYTVTVNNPIQLSEACLFDEPGTYILQGSGVITRASGFTEPLIKVLPGASLEITGQVVIDGGARWVKNGEDSGSAIGAEDSANASTEWAIIDNLGGTLKLSGEAQVRNNNGRCGLWSQDSGKIIIEGGQIHGIRSDDGGGAVACRYSSVTISDGVLWGNEVIDGFRVPKGSAVYALEGGSITITGGTIRDSSGPAAVEGANVTVKGGTFSNNAGAALGSDSSSDTVKVSAGTFTNNADGLYASINGGTAPLHLSGEPTFTSGTDSLVHSGVYLDTAIPTDMIVPLELDQYKFGDRVLTGKTEELVSAHYAQFPIVGVNKDYVVNINGRIAVDSSSDPTDGDVLAERIGGTCTQDQETGVYTIELNGGTAQLDEAFTLEPGTYVLQGSGTITRAQGFKQQLLILHSGVSLEISGNVVIDGGAKWEGAAVEGSAIGATDTSGFTTDKALVDNLGGTVTISGNADICNNNGACGVYCDDGDLFIEGGKIHGIRSNDGGGAVKIIDNSNVLMTNGKLWGNEVVSNKTPKGSAIYAKGGSVTISGGTLSEGSGPAAVEGVNVTVTGGTFSNNAGTALGADSSSDVVSVSGGAFANNAGGLYAPFNGVSAPLHLSGNPSFATDADATVHGMVQVDGELTGSSVRLVPVSYDSGTVAVRGSDDYAMTENDAAKFLLTADAPEGAQLLFDSGNNWVTVQLATSEPMPVKVEVEGPVGDIVYDGQPIVAGEDFIVKVYEYEGGVIGADITDNYSEAGTPGLSFAYRASGSAGDFTDGLPAKVGAYTVRVTADADAANGRAAGSAEFDVTIVRNENLHTVTWMNGGTVLETDEDVPTGAAPSYDGDEPAREADEQYAYAFAGWAAEDGAESGAAVGELQAVTADATYYAAFSKSVNVFTVIFADGQGGAISTQEVEYGGAATAPDDPVREGFSFKGWDADFSNVTADLTVNALWEQDAPPAPAPGLPATVRLKATSFTYDGKAKEPAVVVRDASGADVPATEYTVAYADNVNAGKASATVTFSGDAYAGAKTLSFTIAKAKNTLTAKPKAKAAKVKASKLQRKAVTLKLKKTMAVKKGAAKSKLTYKLGGVSKKKFKKYFKVNKKTGAITVKKGLKKGTYTVKVKVTAAATKNYKASTKTAKVKIRVQ